MMPVWSPGYYRVEDYAAQVSDLSARRPDGKALTVERVPPNRWRIDTGGASRVVLTYRLLCTRYFVTTNWVSPGMGVLNGPATFITVAGDRGRPQEVRLELPPEWPRVATGLEELPDSGAHAYRAEDYGAHAYRAEDYAALVDDPILAGSLAVHEFAVEGVPHALVDVGAPDGWDGEKVADDLRRIVGQTLPLWGELPYKKYVFLNVFWRGGGGLEHRGSTLLTTNPDRVATPEGYRRWLSFAAHEYVHALNVKRLRPVELGPFDYEKPPRTASLWLAEGVTSYLADVAVARAGLLDLDAFLASMSGAIRDLQGAPGRLLQTVEQSSLEVWTNSNSGEGAAATTVSYYMKGRQGTDGHRRPPLAGRRHARSLRAVRGRPRLHARGVPRGGRRGCGGGPDAVVPQGRVVHGGAGLRGDAGLARAPLRRGRELGPRGPGGPDAGAGGASPGPPATSGRGASRHPRRGSARTRGTAWGRRGWTPDARRRRRTDPSHGGVASSSGRLRAASQEGWLSTPMRWHVLLSAIAGLWGLTACDILDPKSCTQDVVFGIQVEVVDSAGTPIVGHLSGYVLQSSFSQPMEWFGDNRLWGAAERPGTYSVVVTAAGYQPWAESGLVVKKGECHVEAVARTATLAPWPSPSSGPAPATTSIP
jgi:M61 glycyl aminopeptidase/Peptidase M61 N-terminal domain